MSAPAAAPAAPAAEAAAEVVRFVNACVRPYVGVYARRSRGVYRLVGTGAWDGPVGVRLRSTDLRDGWALLG